MTRSLLLAALALLVALPATAQSTTDNIIRLGYPLGVSPEGIEMIVYSTDPSFAPVVRTTDALGWIYLPDLPNGTYYAYPNPDAGFITRSSMPLFVPVRPDQSTAGVTIQLPNPDLAILRGRVTNAETGEFARLDRLRLSWQGGVNGPGGTFASTAYAIDGEGRFAIQTLPGTYTDARLIFSSAYEPQTVSFTAEAGVETPFDVSATPVGQGTITGLVTDAVTGAPVADARVELSGPISGFDDTDAQGRYTLSAPAGSYGVTVTSAVSSAGVPYLPETFGGGRFATQGTRVGVDAGAQTSGIDIALDVIAADFSVTFTGRVVDTDGQPVVGASARVDPIYTLSTSTSGTPVAADGSFSVTSTNDFLASYFAILGVRAPGFDTQYVDDQPTAWAADAFAIGSQAVTFDVGTITLLRNGEELPGLAVSGTVRDDETNAPLAGATVTVARLDAPGFYVAITDDAGAYRVDGLDAGQYIALFTKDEYIPEFYPDAEAWTQAEPFDLRDDRAGLDALMGGLNRPVVSNNLTGVFNQIDGAVRDADEAPLRGVLIVARDSEGTAQAFDLTDATGSFALLGVADGSVTLSADRARFGRQTRVVDAGSGATPVFTLGASATTANGETPQTDAVSLDVYPNPARSRTTVAFSLANSGEARVALYDVLGREVVVAAQGERAAGVQEVTVDTASLAPGVYVVRVVAGGVSETRTLTVVR